VQPPFPLASNFPFHPEAGSHSSIFISESLVGLSVAATRQNAGSSLNAAFGSLPRPRPVAGAENAPAATGCAKVIVVSGSAKEARLSHEAANADTALRHAGIAIRATRAVIFPFSHPVSHPERRCRWRRGRASCHPRK